SRGGGYLERGVARRTLGHFTGHVVLESQHLGALRAFDADHGRAPFAQQRDGGQPPGNIDFVLRLHSSRFRPPFPARRRQEANDIAGDDPSTTATGATNAKNPVSARNRVSLVIPWPFITYQNLQPR